MICVYCALSICIHVHWLYAWTNLIVVFLFQSFTSFFDIFRFAIFSQIYGLFLFCVAFFSLLQINGKKNMVPADKGLNEATSFQPSVIQQPTEAQCGRILLIHQGIWMQTLELTSSRYCIETLSSFNKLPLFLSSKFSTSSSSSVSTSCCNS